tara:strand:- start:9824 stop:11023 length:1200 start_codon:yes stop_codon:yes gene_type:complete
MASTFSPLGIELQATGENAGTWGTKTNTNLQIVEQISGGYTTVNFGSDADVTLSVTDGGTGAALAHRILEFTSTGSLTATRNCTIPLDVQNFYILKNATTGGQSITFKYVSGSGNSVTVLNGKTVIAYAKADDGTNPNIASVSLSSDLVDDTSPQLGGDLDTNSFNIAFDDAHGINDENGNEQIVFQTTSSAVNQIDITNAATSGSPSIQATGGDSNINLKVGPKGTGLVEVLGATNPGSIQLNCEANSHGIKLTSPAHSAGQSYELKFPTGNVTAGTFLKVASVSGSGTSGVGQLSFSAAGTSWQAVKTTGFTAAAGEGYFVDTTSSAFTMTLPSSPSIGDEVSFIDYAGTFDSNNLTIGRNSEKIQGTAADLTVSTERAANTLVYTDGTQGWLLKVK